MTEGRATQVIAEVLSTSTDPEARATQVVAEVLSTNTDPQARATQVVAEVLSTNTDPVGQASQVFMQVLRLGTNPPPFVRDQSPAASETDVAYNTPIVLTVDDAVGLPGEAGVDLTTVTIEVQVNSGGYVNAYTSSAFVAPFDDPQSSVIVAPDSSLGYLFSIRRATNFALSDVVDVRVTADDVGGEQSVTTYQFTVTDTDQCYQYESLTTRCLISTYGTIDDIAASGEADASFQFWFKRQSVNGNGVFLDGGAPTELQYRFSLEGTGATVNFGMAFGDGGGATTSVSVAAAIDVGNWHQIIVTKSGTTVLVYLDTVVVPYTDPGWYGFLENHASPVEGQIGQQFGGTNNLTETLQSNYAAWYGTALTPTEVSTLYNSGTPANLVCAATSGDISAAPTYWWRLGDSDQWPICKDALDGPGTARGQDIDISVATGTVEDNAWVLEAPGDGLEVYECPSCTQCLLYPPGSLRIYQNDTGGGGGDGSAATASGPIAALQALGGTTEFSFLFWTKGNVVENSYGHVFNWGDKNAAEAKGFGFEMGQGSPAVRFSLNCQAFGTAPRVGVNSMLTLADQWELIAVTVNLAEAAEIDRVDFVKGSTGLFTDGKIVGGSVAMPSTFTSTANDLILGQPHDTIYWPHKGQYLQAGFYDVKLTLPEIALVYNAGTPHASLVDIPGVRNPILSYQLDQDFAADQATGPVLVPDVTSEILPGIHPGGVAAGCAPVPPPTVFVPDTVPRDGGYIVNVTAAGVADGDYYVHVGPLGTVADPQCYSGISGQADVISIIGGAFDCVVPILPIGGPYVFTLIDVATETPATTDPGLTIVAHPVRSLVLAYRGLLPRHWAAGYRDISQLDFPQE